MRVLGPERLAGQGIDSQQDESGNKAILHLLTEDVAGEQVDLVATWRGDDPESGTYEVWAKRGMVRFRRLVDDDGQLEFEIVDVIGENPLANQDPLALATLDEEKKAAAESGFDAEDATRRFIAPAHQSYPFGYERIAQLFDSPNAPDLAVSSLDWCFGVSPGTHGALHVRQARAPLWFAGPGIRQGRHEIAIRAVDIAPTCLSALGFPLIDGKDATGATSSERGVDPDVYLARQDGRVVDELLDAEGPQPERMYVFLLDGMHQTELEDRLANDPNSIPNLRRLRDRAAVLTGGSIVNFPSITWPSHTAITTGAWCGHHDVVNPSYYLRDTRETVSPQGQALRTEGFANPDVESLYEAFHRVYPGCTTAAINAPFGRSAKHAGLEGRLLTDKERLKERTKELAVDQNDRWVDHPPVANESVIDTRGLAQILELLDSEDIEAPRFVYHELAVTDGAGHEFGPHDSGVRDALDESDRRIGRVLDKLEEKGLLDGTLFVVSADHGMAPQDISLEANPSRRVRKILRAEVAEPLVWLQDVHVTIERASDRRTARVIVADDPDTTGERPPVAGARVVVRHGDMVIADGDTNEDGVFGFATPGEVADADLVASITVEERNDRLVRFDRASTAIDLAGALYG